jgi:hypothetical protein
MMVKDILKDLGDTIQFNGWRGISCGAILAPVIQSKRAMLVGTGRPRK